MSKNDARTGEWTGLTSPQQEALLGLCSGPRVIHNMTALVLSRRGYARSLNSHWNYRTATEMELTEDGHDLVRGRS